MTVTASRTQIQRYYETEFGNCATKAGDGNKNAVLTLYSAAFPYIYIDTQATTKNATLYIDGSIDGTNFSVSITNAQTVTAGTSYQKAITNVGYRAIKVSITQAGTGTTDVYYVMK